MDGPTREIFSRADELYAIGLGVPEVAALARDLRTRGIPVRPDVLTFEEAHAAIREALGWS
jgi:energy-coupling factor transport system ATP-binding protein